MKLAEALIQRGDLQKRIEQMHQRLKRSARTQEDESAPEEPKALLAELSELIKEFGQLVSKINQSNSQASFEHNGKQLTITEALAERDAIMRHRQILENVIETAMGMDGNNRYLYAQIKSFSNINVPEVQAEIDRLSRDYRELDTQIQATNWTTDLSE